MGNDGGWKRRGSRYLFESSWFNLRQDEVSLPSGESITYTLVEHPGYAMVVPLLDDHQVILERVYRYTVQEVVLECPSGGLDGDPPETAARRELEETGWVAEADGRTASSNRCSVSVRVPSNCPRAEMVTRFRPFRAGEPGDA